MPAVSGTEERCSQRAKKGKEDMTQEQKALEILMAMARLASDGKSLTIAEDWGFGSATVIDQDGAHTHFGSDHGETEEKNFEAFVNGLHGLMVENRGLSWVKPSNAGLGIPETKINSW